MAKKNKEILEDLKLEVKEKVSCSEIQNTAHTCDQILNIMNTA